MSRNSGFTLLEILVALFVFTIVAMIMTHALHTVLQNEEVTTKHAARLAQLQIALIFLEHDLEQAIDRPVIGKTGMQEVAFIGTKQQIIFTHGGVANPQGILSSSSLQRSKYNLADKKLQRASWEVLDQVADSTPTVRNLLNEVSDLRFEFLDGTGVYRDTWPAANDAKAESLPAAVKISFAINHWGKITEIYIIPGKAFITNAV